MRKITFITDIHLDEAFPLECGVDARKNWALLLEDVQKRGIKELIFGDDIGAPASNQWFFESVKHFHKFSLVLGNHDTFAEASKYYHQKGTTEQQSMYYFSEDEYFRFIVMDSAAATISTEQHTITRTVQLLG